MYNIILYECKFPENTKRTIWKKSSNAKDHYRDLIRV